MAMWEEKGGEKRQCTVKDEVNRVDHLGTVTSEI